MEDAVEFVVMILGAGLYGTEARPRHPVWKNTLRVVAFGGGALAIASMLSLLGDTRFPVLAILFWLACSLIVLVAEYELGSRRIAFAGYGMAILLIGTFFVARTI